MAGPCVGYGLEVVGGVLQVNLAEVTGGDTAARAYLSADKNLTGGGGGVWTFVDTWSEDYDLGDDFADDAYVFPANGLYDVRVQTKVLQANDPQTLILGLFVNGLQTYHGTDDTRSGVVSGDTATLVFNDVIQQVAGSALTVWIHNVQDNTCVASGADGSSSWSVRRVG